MKDAFYLATTLVCSLPRPPEIACSAIPFLKPPCPNRGAPVCHAKVDYTHYGETGGVQKSSATETGFVGPLPRIVCLKY